MTLTPERWQRARDVLHEAMQMDEGERSDFLDSQCASDPSLRVELKELLAAEGEIGSSFLEEPALAQASLCTDTESRHTVLPSGTKLGPYVVQSLIGAGGMGEVYRARDTLLKRDVAIKVLPTSLSRDPARLRRFQLEAEAAATLNHANIISIFHIGQQDGSPYIVTELLEGETLRERLRHGALRLRDAIDVAIQTAKGLGAAHEKGIAHRDLKPENLFLAKDGRVKILDFGLAKLMSPASSVSDGPTKSLHDQTDAGRILGTVGYMSPEQVRGQTADGRSDIFALGCVLYEMLTGRRAFQKATSADTMSAILNEDPPAAPGVMRSIQPALQRVVHRCLQKAPERRFQSALDLAFALDALSGSGASESGTQPTREQRPASLRRVALIAAASLMALAGYWSLRPEAAPRVSNYVQLTHNGKQKGLVGTDGSRLYLRGTSQVSVTGGEPVPIPTPFPPMHAVDVSPDGSRLLVTQFKDNFGKGSLLWSVPILGGSPRRLGELVGQSGAWSPDGSALAFGNEKDLFVAKADGTEPRKVTTMQDLIRDVTWSPRGSEVQFVTGQGEIPQTWLLWQVSLDGKNLHQVLPGWINSEPVCCGRWTTDGKYLVFPLNGQIWALPQESGFLRIRRAKPVQLTSSPMVLDTPIPSRDGKKLFVVGRTSRGELTRYNVKTGRFESFLGGISVEFVDYSRDGQSLAYVSYPEGTLWRAKVDGSERVQLTYPPMHVVLPRLSPDGKTIIFSDNLAPNRPSKLFEVSTEGGTLRQLLPDDHNFQSDPTWSPDGNRIAFGGTSDDASSAVRILNLANRQVLTLPGSQGFYGPRWSPNGRYIVAQTSDGETLMLFDFQTQKWTKLAKDTLGWLNWSENGDYIYFFHFGAPSAVFRLRMSDRQIEPVAPLNFGTAGQYGSWLGLAPDNSPILLRDNGTQDIYALDWEEP